MEVREVSSEEYFNLLNKYLNFDMISNMHEETINNYELKRQMIKEFITAKNNPNKGFKVNLAEETILYKVG